MFFPYLNFSRQTDRHGFPDWIIVQADDAESANAKLLALVGDENVSDIGWKPFDFVDPRFPGLHEPTLGYRRFVNGERSESIVSEATYKVVYSDGTTVKGKL